MQPAFFLHLLFTTMNACAMIKSRGNGIPGNEKPGRAERQEEMERNDMVMGVLAMYDRVSELEAENASLKAGMVTEISSPDGDDPLAGVKARIMQVGRKKIVDDALGYWNDVRVTRNDDGAISVQSYDKWLSDKVSKVPDFMSIIQLKEICSAELHAVYESKKKKAMDELLKSEQDDEE